MNFRKRIITTFLVFALTLTAVFGVLLDGSTAFVEDEIIRDFLSENMVYLEEKVNSEVNKGELIATPKIKGILTSVDNIPAELLELEEGFHEAEDFHALVKTLESGVYAGEKIILLFDESTSFLDKNESTIVFTIFLFSFIILLLAAIVCVYLAKSVATPIEYLATKVSAQEGGVLGDAALSRKDELGELARAFSLSVERVHGLLAREKNFTRYASHELRTPLTVVKNNVDILTLVIERINEKQGIVDDKLSTTCKSSIIRLDQALWFMEQQINTLLLLARGQYQPKFVDVELSTLLGDIEAYFPDLIIVRKFSPSLSLYADSIVVFSILTNILNNVNDHGADTDGKIRAVIEADASGLYVSNNINSLNENTVGKRFGLEIVKQLCDVMLWRFSTQETEQDGGTWFSVKVSF